MKKCLVVFLLIVLCGCKADADVTDQALLLRNRLLSAKQCSFDATITADYGDHTYSFTLSCHADREGNISFTVLQPETISGITGTIDPDGGKLTFDDAALAFPVLTDDQLSPVSAPWILVKTLRGGYIAACSEGRVTLRDSYEAEAMTVDVYLDAQGLPHEAEIYWKGRRILVMELKNFVLS